MKFDIDISLFTKIGAYGNITGTIELPVCPHGGDVVSFYSPTKKNIKPITIEGFLYHSAVTNVRFSIGSEEKISLALDDITVNNEKDAEELVTYLSEGFGLFFDKY